GAPRPVVQGSVARPHVQPPPPPPFRTALRNPHSPPPLHLYLKYFRGTTGPKSSGLTVRKSAERRLASAAIQCLSHREVCVAKSQTSSRTSSVTSAISFGTSPRDTNPLSMSWRNECHRT